MANLVPRSLRSVPASIGVLRAQHKSFGEAALKTASTVANTVGGVVSLASIPFLAPFIPAIGITAGAAFGAGFGFNFIANHLKSRNEKAALADWYRDQVATQLGMDPARVTVRDLEMAATVNPAIAKVLHGVERTRRAENGTEAAQWAAGTAASLVPIPGLGGLVHAGVGIAMAATGGAAANWLLSGDKLKDPQFISEKLADMQKNGESIAPIHTFMLRVAQNTQLQDAIKQQVGTEYYNLSSEQQAMVMSSFPRVAAYAEKDARFLANGGAVQELMFIQPEGKQWTQRVSAQAPMAQVTR